MNVLAKMKYSDSNKILFSCWYVLVILYAEYCVVKGEEIEFRF